MADDSEDSINELYETVERKIPPKKATVNDYEEGHCIIHACNTEKGTVSKFQQRSLKTALNAARICRDTLLSIDWILQWKVSYEKL